MSLVAHLPQHERPLAEADGSPPPSILLTGRRRLSQKERSLSVTIFEEFRSDPRYEEFVRGCLNCGECTSGCPAARFYEFSPREMLQVAYGGDAPTLWDAMQEKIWACCQCYSCTMRCRMGNDVAGVISLMRELAVRHALPSARVAVRAFRESIELLTTHGTFVSSDSFRPEVFRDWGPFGGWPPEDWGVAPEVMREAIPMDLLHTTKEAWEVSVQTSLELFRIYEEAGVLETLRGFDPDLAELIVSVVEERREEFQRARERYGAEIARMTGAVATFPG